MKDLSRLNHSYVSSEFLFLHVTYNRNSPSSSSFPTRPLGLSRQNMSITCVLVSYEIPKRSISSAGVS